jgi:hypothetical protein
MIVWGVLRVVAWILARFRTVQRRGCMQRWNCGLEGTVSACMQVADVQPRHSHCESPQRADHSSIGFGGSALGGQVMSGLRRHSSFASSDAFGGLQSIGSVAGSDEERQRVALPPLSTLPRVSREGMSSKPDSFFFLHVCRLPCFYRCLLHCFPQAQSEDIPSSCAGSVVTTLDVGTPKKVYVCVD